MPYKYTGNATTQEKTAEFEPTASAANARQNVSAEPTTAPATLFYPTKKPTESNTKLILQGHRYGNYWN